MNIAADKLGARAPLFVTSIALVVFAFGYLLRSVPAAQALPEGPDVTGGTNPYLSFTGATSTSVDLYTVPNDRIFVLTGACTSNNNANLRESSTIKVYAQSSAMFCSTTGTTGGFLARGQGHLVFAPGNTVGIETATSVVYTLQGYLARP